MKLSLYDIFPFSACSDNGKAILSHDGYIKERTFISGETMFSSEHAICVLLTGRAVVSALESGRSVQLNKLSAGDIFGVASLFSAADFPTLVTASCECKTVFIDEAVITRLIMEDADFAIGYTKFLTGKIQFLNERIRAFTAPDAQRKLAVYILQGMDENCMLNIPSMAELAKKLDIGRASLYRATDSLSSAGIIVRLSGAIRVTDIDKLKATI